MKKKIKLRDLTSEQFERWMKDNCGHAKYVDCTDCPFFFSNCIVDEKKSWVNNKDLYSDKFLDIEIEVADEPLLTPKEKEYLEGVIRPFKDIVEYIAKSNMDNNLEYLCINIKDDYHLCFPNFLKNKYYKGLEIEKKYTLKVLGLFKE